MVCLLQAAWLANYRQEALVAAEILTVSIASKKKMFRVAVICVLFQTCVVLSAPLQWPKIYQTSGQIILPYGDIAEPFTAVVDMTRGMSYLNTYDSQLMQQ